jgi:hypothetical protein
MESEKLKVEIVNAESRSNFHGRGLLFNSPTSSRLPAPGSNLPLWRKRLRSGRK